jgi:hypothetical protein
MQHIATQALTARRMRQQIHPTCQRCGGSSGEGDLSLSSPSTSGASALPDFPVGYQPLPTFVEKDFSTSVVRMHETGPTSRAQKRTLDSERSECDYKIPGDVYVTAIPGPSLPPLDRRPPPPAP